MLHIGQPLLLGLCHAYHVLQNLLPILSSILQQAELGMS